MNRVIIVILILVFNFSVSCKNKKSNIVITDIKSQNKMTTFSTNIPASFEEIPVSENEISKDLFLGNIVDSKKWEDKNGINLFIIADTTTNDTSINLTCYQIHAYHYLLKSDKFELLKDFKDFNYYYSNTSICSLCEQSLDVLDLDKNGIGEVSFVYFFQNEKQPDNIENSMTLIMIQNGKKQTIKGTNYSKIINENIIVESSFNSYPILKKYALKKWTKEQSTHH
ncbi:MAG: hypothetical protein JXL97_07595 [Bacteroidales bacterium]|nr:hypothetical protein [Bacteroidales bacterium]